MKKIGRIVLVVMVAFIMLFAFACYAHPNVNVRNPQTDTSFVVRGNGSIAVQYGPYVYFVNGTRMRFSDEEARNNRWGDVILGGIYRARLNDGVDEYENLVGGRIDSPYGGLDDWAAVPLIGNAKDTEYRFEFDLVDPAPLRFGERSDLFEDDDEFLEEEFGEREELFETINKVDNTVIAPKFITTAGGNGGIFIFDNHIYFATPHSNRDGTGRVRYDFVDFYRMRLDGSRVQRIFSTRGVANDLPFAFYHMGGNRVVLVSAARNNRGLIDIIRVVMNGNNVGSPHLITSEATSVYFPTREVFDRTATDVRLEDFIFFTRDATRDDSLTEGNMIIVASPDGNMQFTYFAMGTETEILSVRDDTLFYTNTQHARHEARFSTLHEPLMQHSARYRDFIAGGGKRLNVSGIAFRDTLDVTLASFTSTYFFRPDAFANAAYVVAHGGGGVFLYSYIDDSYSVAQRHQILNTTPDKLFIHQDYMYFVENNAISRVHVFRADYTQRMTGDAEIIRGEGMTATMVAGHLMFFSRVDRWTHAGLGYAHFLSIRNPGNRHFFVGTLREDDIPTDDQVRQYIRDGTGGNIEDPGNGEENGEDY